MAIAAGISSAPGNGEHIDLGPTCRKRRPRAAQQLVREVVVKARLDDEDARAAEDGAIVAERRDGGAAMRAIRPSASRVE